MMPGVLQRFRGKTAVVTGGASGIGRAIAERLAAEGAEIHLLDLNAEGAAETVKEIQAAGGRAVSHRCDVSLESSVEEVFNAIPCPHVLVNAAGIAHVGHVLETSVADFDRLLAVNARGVFLCSRAALRGMVAARRGVILNIASVASKLGIENRFAYSASKGAVLAMTLSVARDFVSQGIRCNCVCPARVHTPFVDGYLAKHFPNNRDEMFAKLNQWQPLGRMGRPEEIASLAAFLCSDEAAFITGSAYDIDGGVTLLR